MSGQDVAGKGKILMVVGNTTVSPVTGWPVGFWWAELTHPYWEFTHRGYAVEIASPKGGAVQGDAYSDPEDASGYSADDFISLGFKKSPRHAALLNKTKSLAEIQVQEYGAIFVIGGQSPPVTMIDDTALHQLFATFYEQGRIAAVICHGTCILLRTKLSNGQWLVDGKTWTGFANTEEQYAEQVTGRKIQPFWIETEAKKLANTRFVAGPPFSSYAVADGNLVTGQQQHSGEEAARLVIQALERQADSRKVPSAATVVR